MRVEGRRSKREEGRKGYGARTQSCSDRSTIGGPERMIEELNEEIEVQAVFSRRGARPYAFTWRGRRYRIQSFNLYHSAYKGETLFHYFSVSTSASFFELCLNSKTLRWTLVKVYPST